MDSRIQSKNLQYLNAQKKSLAPDFITKIGLILRQISYGTVSYFLNTTVIIKT